MTRNFIFKNIIYMLLLSMVFSIQSANNILPEIYGYKIDILIPILIAIAILDDIYTAVNCSFIVSLMYEYNFALIEGISVVYFIIMVIFIHFFSKNYYTKNVVTQIMFSTIVMLLYRLLMYIFIQGDFLIYFKITSAEILIAGVFSPFAYAIVQWIGRRVGD